MRLCVVDLCCCGTPITYCYFNDTIRTAKPLQNYLNQHNRIGPVKRGRAKNQPRETPQNFTMQCVYATYPQLHSPITLYHISRVCLFFPNFQHKRKHVRTPALVLALSRTVTGQIFRSTHTHALERAAVVLTWTLEYFGSCTRFPTPSSLTPLVACKCKMAFTIYTRRIRKDACQTYASAPQRKIKKYDCTHVTRSDARAPRPWHCALQRIGANQLAAFCVDAAARSKMRPGRSTSCPVGIARAMILSLVG